MNRRWIFALLYLAVLNGCTNAHVEEGVMPSEPAVISDQAEALPDEEAAEVTNLSDAEITVLMDAYLIYERYTVYSSSSMEMEPNYIELDGRFFHKVTDEAYDTWAEWTAFVESIFCGDALAAEMERIETEQRFVNVDGNTYCQAGDMGWHVSGVYIYEVTESAADRVVIEMTREELNPGGETLEHINTFALRHTENGWRIGEWMQ